MPATISVAVLIDAGYLWKNGKRVLSRHWMAQDIIDMAKACLKCPDERLYRVFFYDCQPFDGERLHPATKNYVRYADTDLYKERCAFLKELAAMDYIAFRKGRLSHKGWKLRQKALEGILNGSKTQVDAEDLIEDFQQKAVDMKIGLDVAWLSSRSIVDTLVLIGSDTDYVPAMKHARREGARVVVVSFPNPKKNGKPDLHPDLLEHADECRLLSFTNGMFSLSQGGCTGT